jgi:transcriptional regulator with XRE-family HTH domain
MKQMPNSPTSGAEDAPAPPARSEIVSRFRDRLAELFTRSGMKQAAFARKVGLDRSTLSQLLAATTDRLPRAENIAAIARAEGVSIDWLLGLSEEGQAATDVMRRSIQVERDARSPADRRLDRWHDEADTRRAIPPATLERLAAQVADSERRHTGEIRIYVEAGLPMSYLWRGATARERANAMFAKLGVWDTARPGPEVIAERIVRGTRPGSIVLLHDGDGYDPAGDRMQTARALPRAIRGLRDRGYSFVTLATP